MNKGIYLPDDLAEALERHKDEINLSAVCQAALRTEIRRIEERQTMNKIVIEDENGIPRSFIGREVTNWGNIGFMYYITDKGTTITHGDAGQIWLTPKSEVVEKLIAPLADADDPEGRDVAVALIEAYGFTDVAIPLE